MKRSNQGVLLSQAISGPMTSNSVQFSRDITEDFTKWLQTINHGGMFLIIFVSLSFMSPLRILLHRE